MKKRTSFILFIFIIACNFSLNATAQSDIKQQIKSESVVLMDGDTGQVLFEKNMNERMYPASITKIMTALLALENGNLNNTITMSYDAVFSIGRDTSHIALDEKENLTLEQALYALAIASANDAANGIAELISGNVENFAAHMTEKAKEVGAANTSFTNAHGLPDADHYTTAYDMARIMAAAIKIPEFLKIFGAVSYEMPPTNKQTETRYFNRKNSLLTGEYKYDGVIAEKTGWTPASGYTYAAVAERNGRTLIAIVMKSPDEAARWQDTASSFEYGFDEFIPVNFSAKEFTKEQYTVEGADGKKVDTALKSEEDFNCLLLKSLSKEDIEVKYTFSTDGISGKIQGKAIFTLNSALSNLMFVELGEVNMQVHFNVDEKNALINGNISIDNEKQTEVKNNNSIFSVISTIVSAILKIIGVITVGLVFSYIKRYMNVQKKKKRRLNYKKNMRKNIENS